MTIDNPRPKKSLGQNFLRDPRYLGKIVHAARVGRDDQVLEIGPGLGDLTRALTERAKRVLAVELDDRLVSRLRSEFGSVPNFELVHADALEYDYASLTGRWKVVANLPYYISTPLIQKLIAGRAKFVSLTLMLQREVAERISAPPGGRDYGYFSVLVRFYSVPRMEFPVPAEAFTPRPKVDSAVITLAIRDLPAFPVQDEAFFIRVVKAAFSQRRKTLRNSLKLLGLPDDAVASAASAAGIDPGRRAETLSVEEFCGLSDFLLVFAR
jgi:16S rRNA (adenine1518-N6/adenine1519-N6)-dimethyltransferase